jgi:hypothetical protein
MASLRGVFVLPRLVTPGIVRGGPVRRHKPRRITDWAMGHAGMNNRHILHARRFG